jgi:hypothetical protein
MKKNRGLEKIKDRNRGDNTWRVDLVMMEDSTLKKKKVL